VRNYRLAGIPYKMQWPLPVEYKGHRVNCGYRVDLLVDDKLIVELKAVDRVLNIHEAQLLTYMRLSHVSVGLLINFHVQLLKNGIKRFVL